MGWDAGRVDLEKARWEKEMDLMVVVKVSMHRLVPHEIKFHVRHRIEWQSLNRSGSSLVVLVTFAFGWTGIPGIYGYI